MPPLLHFSQEVAPTESQIDQYRVGNCLNTESPEQSASAGFMKLQAERGKEGRIGVEKYWAISQIEEDNL